MKNLFIKFAMILLLLTAVSYFFSTQLIQEYYPHQSQRSVRIGVIFNGNKMDGGWNEAQYQGFEAIRKEMGLEIIYREYVPDMDDQVAQQVMEDMVKKDHVEILFASSYNYGPALQRVAEEYPEVKFLHVSGNHTGTNLATYFGRIYQARYLTGIVAGMQTKTGHIGYVAAFPIPEVIRGINAFTLGARSVNPAAVVHVRWSETWNDSGRELAATSSLLATYPIDVLAQHQNTTYPMQAAQTRGGVQVIGYNLDRSADFPDIFLTASVWNWGAFFKARLQECFEGRFKGRAYFEGYEKGVFDIAPLSPLVKPEAAAKVEAAREKLRSGTWDVFYGPVYDQQGNLRIRPGENISDKELLGTFDWFVNGVEGSPKGNTR